MKASVLNWFPKYSCFIRSCVNSLFGGVPRQGQVSLFLEMLFWSYPLTERDSGWQGQPEQYCFTFWNSLSWIFILNFHNSSHTSDSLPSKRIVHRMLFFFAVSFQNIILLIWLLFPILPAYSTLDWRWGWKGLSTALYHRYWSSYLPPWWARFLVCSVQRSHLTTFCGTKNELGYLFDEALSRELLGQAIKTFHMQIFYPHL